MYFKTKILTIFFVILSFVFSVKEAYGTTYFSDNFDQENLENWIFIAGNSGQESWKNVNKKLIGEVTYGGSSFLLAKSFWNLSNYSIRVDSMNENGVDQNIVFRINEDRSQYYLLDLRFSDPDWSDGGEIVLWKYNSNIGYSKMSTFRELNRINLTQNEVHKIQIEANDSNIKIYFDTILIINIDDENPILSGSFGFYNWGGSFCYGSTKNFFDNLIVGDFDYEQIITPTPVKKPKIIFLPGLGASWNTDAVVYNKSVDANQWKITPFVKNYKGLINALKQNGLEENTDFYVWNYDWRKPVNEIVTNLNSFINQKVSEDEKVILIGHSLGGLVSRIWAEDNKNDSRLEKVIDLASPNLGSADTYEIWNGGQVSDLTKISSIAFKILLKIQGVNTKTDMEAVRKYFPIVKDLLPTFNFISKNGNILTNNKLETNNTYLSDKNNMVDIGTTLKLFTGNGFKTIDSINLKNNNVFDKVLGIWPDGRINKVSYSTNGDGTVLTKSANYGKTDFVEINSKHGEIIDKTVNQVMTEIGLSQTDVIGETQDLSNSLVVFVGSPVNYSVKCDNESPVNDDNGFVVIKNNNYKSCNINLVGIGNGLIHVVTGNTNDDNWSYWEKNIIKGEINNIKINPTNGQIINDKDNISFLKSIIKADINSLLTSNKNNKFLKEALKNLDKNQPKILIVNIFGFRNGNNERILSEKIIDNSTIWLSLVNKCSKNEANSGLKIISSYQNLINNLISVKNKKGSKISENAAISYQKMDKILESNQNKINQKDYLEVCANNFAGLSYGSEVLVKAYNKNDFKMWVKNDL